MDKHTPVWYAEEDSGNEFWFANTFYLIKQKDSENEFVAIVKKLDDANLVKAAPALLESCERVLALFLVIQIEYAEIRFHSESKIKTVKIADIVNDLSAAVALGKGGEEL